MQIKLLISILILSLSTFTFSYGQKTDTVRQSIKTLQSDTIITTNTKSSYVDDDFSPGLLFFALIGIGLVFICIGIGIVLAAIGLFIIFGLVSFGILSTSIIIGLNAKSFAKGFRTFLLLAASTVGLSLGVITLYCINKLLNLHLATNITVITGAISGLVGGILLGQITYIVIKKLTDYFKKRLIIA